MRVFLSPVGSDKQQVIKFNNNKVQLTLDNKSYLYDFSNFTDGQMIGSTAHITSAKRVNGELSVDVINYINNGATEQVKYPKWQLIERQDELDADAQVMQIDWITQTEIDAIINAPTPSTDRERIAELEQIINMILMGEM